MDLNIKGIINNSTVDPNKILPMRYTWARQHYKDGVANNWTPERNRAPPPSRSRLITPSKC